MVRANIFCLGELAGNDLPCVFSMCSMHDHRCLALASPCCCLWSWFLSSPSVQRTLDYHLRLGQVILPCVSWHWKPAMFAGTCTAHVLTWPRSRWEGYQRLPLTLASDFYPLMNFGNTVSCGGLRTSAHRLMQDTQDCHMEYQMVNKAGTYQEYQTQPWHFIQCELAKTML